MKILFITDLYPAYPGQSRIEQSYALHGILKHSSGDKTDILVIRPLIVNIPLAYFRKGTDEFVLDGITVINCPVLKVPKRPFFFTRGILRCIEKRSFKPDAVIAHLGFNLLIGMKVSLSLQIPMISGIHMGDLMYTPRMTGKKQFREIMDHSAGIACRSDLIREGFLRRFPHLSGKTFTAFSGIPEDELMERSKLETKLGKWRVKPAERTVRLVTAGRLDSNKNVEMVLRALSAVGKRSEWEYTVVGDGMIRDNLEKLADSLGIGERVVFTGRLDRCQVLDRLEESDVFVLPSAVETFGMVFIEAMAKGNIVIASRNTGVDGFVTDGVSGFLVEPSGESELADILRRIMETTRADEMTEMVMNAYRLVSGYTERQASSDYFSNVEKTLALIP